jgi:hypothetical protein
MLTFPRFGEGPSHLQNISLEDGFVTFTISFKKKTHANDMLFYVLRLEHTNTIHLIIQKQNNTTLNVKIEYINEHIDTIKDMIKDIDYQARKISGKNGKVR